jgi:hypothetical protein
MDWGNFLSKAGYVSLGVLIAGVVTSIAINVIEG